MASLYFLIQPIDNYKMEFPCDDKKEKPLSGRQSHCPTVELCDSSGEQRPGKLKVVCVDAESYNAGGVVPLVVYRMHRHKLVDYMNRTTRCDKFGVATYEFGREDYNADKLQFPLRGLSIRRSNESLKEVEANWSMNQKDKFDPFGVGFGDSNRKVDLNRARLCCQVIFEGGKSHSNVIVSDEIQNCKPEIIVHEWLGDTVAKATGGDMFVVFVSELKKMQRQVYAVFFDELNVQFAEVGISYNHCNRAIRITVPSYTNRDIIKPVTCKFHLAVKNEAYKSAPMYFNYLPVCQCNSNFTENSTPSASAIHEQTISEHLLDLGNSISFTDNTDAFAYQTHSHDLHMLHEFTTLVEHQADISINSLDPVFDLAGVMSELE